MPSHRVRTERLGSPDPVGDPIPVRNLRPGTEAGPSRAADRLVRTPLGVEGTFPVLGAPISAAYLGPVPAPLDLACPTPVAFAPVAARIFDPSPPESAFARRVRSWFSPFVPSRRRER